MLLADVAHVGGVRDGGACEAHAAVAERAFALRDQLRVRALDLVERRFLQAREPRAHKVVAQVRMQHAERAEVTGRAGNDDPRHPDLARDRRGVKRAGAAVGDQAKGGGIQAAIGRDALDRIGHRGNGDAQDAVGGIGEAQAERLGDLLADGASRGRFVELHLATEEAPGVQAPQHQVCVGHRGTGSPQPIARRPRIRAGALRPDAQGAAHIDHRDAAAAGADFEDVHHRYLDRQRLVVATDQRSRSGEHLAAIDDARLGGGSAHVEGDRVRQTQFAAQGLRAHHAGRRAGFQHADAFGLGLARLVQPAGRLNEQKGAAEAAALQMPVDVTDVPADARTDERIRNGGRAALELPVLLRQLVRSGDEGLRQPLLHDALDPLFVGRIHVAMQQQDGNGFDLRGLQLVAERMDLGVVQSDEDFAGRRDPLAHLEPQRPFDQRHVLAKEQVVGVGAVDAADLVGVAEAFGDEERGLRAGTLEHRVDGDGRAMKEQPGIGVLGLGFLHAVGDAVDQAAGRG